MHNLLIDRNAKRGENIVLDASPSNDPDNDKLTYHWWTHAEAGTYKGSWQIDSDRKRTKISIPQDAHLGDLIHIVCEVTDSGTPALTRYQRVIITVAE